MALSEDAVHKYSDVALARINKTVGNLRRLFLVEDLIDSIKVSRGIGSRDPLQLVTTHRPTIALAKGELQVVHLRNKNGRPC